MLLFKPESILDDHGQDVGGRKFKKNSDSWDIDEM